MKIVFLTNKSSHGCEILKALTQNSISVAAILILKKPHIPSGKTLKKALKIFGIKFLLLTLMKKIRITKVMPWQKAGFYQAFSKKIFEVSDFNTLSSANIIKKLKPDLIVLGGAPILKKEIIEIPKIGVLNIHPGLLPKYRGVDVIAWAILNNDDVGVTLHFVDEGIDTGKIVARKKIDFKKFKSLDEIKSHAERLGAELLVEELKKNRLESIKSCKQKRFPLYRHMTPGQKAKVLKIIKQ